MVAGKGSCSARLTRSYRPDPIAGRDERRPLDHPGRSPGMWSRPPGAGVSRDRLFARFTPTGANVGAAQFVQEFIAKGICRGQVRVIAAQRKMGKTDSVNQFPYDAAIACAWDEDRYYYWLSTRSRAGRDASHRPRPHPDAIKLLIVKAMSHAEQLGLTFDADGVSTPGTLHLYKDILSLHEEEHVMCLSVYHSLPSFLTQLSPAYRPVSRSLMPCSASRSASPGDAQAGCHARMFKKRRVRGAADCCALTQSTISTGPAGRLPRRATISTFNVARLSGLLRKRDGRGVPRRGDRDRLPPRSAGEITDATARVHRGFSPARAHMVCRQA